MMITSRAFALGPAAMLAAMLPAIAAAQAPAHPGHAMMMMGGTRLEIAAEGAVTRVPDVATISAGVVTQARTAAAAMAQNADRMAAAVAALKQAGVADRDIRTASISLSPQYRYGENVPPVITGYQASNQVSVRFRDVKRAGSILDALVAAGANQINGPDFTIDQPEAAMDEARTQAVATARARAELYAKAAGMRVKRILSISESSSVGQPPMPMMQMARVEKSADTAIEPGDQKLTVALSVVFELE